MSKRRKITAEDVNNIRAHHKTRRMINAAWLLSMSKEDVVNVALAEMSHKNEAYYFILERGLLLEFHKYVNSQKNRVND